MKFIGYLLNAVMAFCLFACSSPLRTRVDSQNSAVTSNTRDGMVYRLPLKAIKITLTVDKDKKRTLTAEATAAYPDLGTRFIVQYNNSQLSSNELALKIDVSGLLSGDASSSHTSQVGDVLKGLASTIGSVGAALDGHGKVVPPVTPPICNREGTYMWLVEPTDAVEPAETAAKTQMTVCQVRFERAILGTPEPVGKNNVRFDAAKANSDNAESGFYYRQALPYLVALTDTSVDPNPVTRALLPMPTRQSPVEFLPVQESLFAKNIVKFSFTDGSPVSYDQALESEWVGLLSLPADLIKSYFGAIGAVFSERSDADKNQAAYLAQISALAVQQLKTQACLSAVQTKDDAKIKAACGQ
ncbi:hypothetical protein ELE36_05540 [Pseudolysobacter antarcticus]|uniref:Lipoprotein n=1 Tax=Pseudolysobacter antarcticus TaxID=2511995 RepID=A0A411HHJ4_9GAMM|nr:hypothetical protein [Pseudolysobacter antarcticus]QBB69874.1 hypothetical protein ELE36_05540 [Pseudolysobacter antarcticus]